MRRVNGLSSALNEADGGHTWSVAAFVTDPFADALAHPQVCHCAACMSAAAVSPDGPQYAILPSSGGAANGKPIFSWDEAAAQIGRPGQFWGASLGSPATVTYAYRSTDPGAIANSTASGFQRFTEAQILATEKALQYWSDVANITFLRVGTGTNGDAAYSNSASILFADYTTGEAGASAFAFYPGSTNSGSQAGDVWVNISIASNANPAYFTAGPRTILHEIGHAIGLAHPSNYNAQEGLTITYAADASYWQDANMFTVMSYFASASTGANLGGFANSPQMHDIAAAQRLYGANASTRSGDTVYGFNSTSGRENSTIMSAGEATVFSLWDGGGYDTLDLSGYSQNADIDLRPESFSSAGPDTIGGGAVYNISIPRGVVIERAIGGSGNDTITGNDAANTLIGNGGNDTLIGGDGDDILIDTSGNNSFDGGTGVDLAVVSFAGHAGALNFSVGNSVVLENGVAAPDATFMSIERVSITGGSGPDVFTGGALDDTLLGGAGIDTLTGGPGNDTYGVDSASDVVTELFNQGNDTLQTSVNNVTLASYPNVENLTYTGTVAFIGQGNAQVNIIVGGPGNDYIYAYDGDDTGSGGAGIDVIIMGAGNDTVFGGDGQDYIYGNDGNDTLNGEGGVDVLLGGEGDDTMFGGDGGDYFYGENGNDTAFGEAGNDIFVLTAGNDTASGGDGQDYFYMGDGNDTLNGGDGVDVMLGEAGDDVFNPGLGVDYVFMGAGSDRLNIDIASSGVTVLNDFTPGAGSADIISLTGTGWTSFAQVQANISDFTASGGFCILTLDADTSIWFIGVQPSQLTAGDFVFGP